MVILQLSQYLMLKTTFLFYNIVHILTSVYEIKLKINKQYYTYICIYDCLKRCF